MTFSLREQACQCQKLQNIQTKDLYSACILRDGSCSFFLKRSFRYENDDEKTKNETISILKS